MVSIAMLVYWRLYDLYGYGSIPINTISNGMNIHKSQLFWCELQGYPIIRYIFSGMNIHKSQLFWCELQGYYWFWPIPISVYRFQWALHTVVPPVRTRKVRKEIFLHQLVGLWYFSYYRTTMVYQPTDITRRNTNLSILYDVISIYNWFNYSVHVFYLITFMLHI